jgi:hypothetical protein
MTACKQCSADLPPGKKVYCSEQCSWRWNNAKRSTGPMPSKTEQVETPAIHQTAQNLIVTGHLPAPYQIDAHDQRPLWDFVGLAELLNQRPDQLVQLLQANGPAYLPGAGIPSSWRMLIEL